MLLLSASALRYTRLEPELSKSRDNRDKLVAEGRIKTFDLIVMASEGAKAAGPSLLSETTLLFGLDQGGILNLDQANDEARRRERGQESHSDAQVANAEVQVAQARPPVRPPQRGRASRRGPGGQRGEAVFGEHPSRREAYREAKEIGGIPRGQQPEMVRRVRLTDQTGNVTTTEFVFRRADGATVRIRNDFLGHTKGNLGPHFNVEVQLPSGATESLPGRGHVPYE